MKYRFLFDVDSVVRDFVSGVLTHVNRHMCTSHQHDDVDQWNIGEALDVPGHVIRAAYDEVTKPAEIRALGVYKGARLAVDMINKFADVYWVTAPMSAPHWTYETEKWLARHFDVDHHRVVHTSAKHVVAGHVFLDDKIGNLVAWRECNPDGYPLLWSCAGNRKHQHTWSGLVVDGWSSLIDMARVICRDIDNTVTFRWRH